MYICTHVCVYIIISVGEREKKLHFIIITLYAQQSFAKTHTLSRVRAPACLILLSGWVYIITRTRMYILSDTADCNLIKSATYVTVPKRQTVVRMTRRIKYVYSIHVPYVYVRFWRVYVRGQRIYYYSIMKYHYMCVCVCVCAMTRGVSRCMHLGAVSHISSVPTRR